MPGLTTLTATAMATAVREGQLTPLEILDAHLDRIAALNPALNAIVALDAERARATARTHNRQGTLAGVPLTIKSSLDVAGMPAACGSRWRAAHIATTDATLVARLRAAGAVILGVTNVPEFLMAWETDNALYGRTNSPWDASRTPGGSSGGESAAIAAGLSAGGIGSDGGGSIRVPAHFTGICGLKPTPGRIPATGHFPGSVGPFVQLGVVGPLARTVADVRLIFEACAGLDWGDVRAVDLPISHAQTKGLCVAWFDDNGIAPVTPETRAAVRAAAGALSAAGIEVEEKFPSGLDGFFELFVLFFVQCGTVFVKPLVDELGDRISPTLLEYWTKAIARPVPSFSDLVLGWAGRDQMKLTLLAQMERFPILLSPVCSTPAFRHGERAWEVDGRRVEYLESFSYCELCNVLGLPAAVVPAGISPEGLPIGVQIIGRPFEEELVLAVAEIIESARLFQGVPEEPVAAHYAASEAGSGVSPFGLLEAREGGRPE
jgi:amidase